MTLQCEFQYKMNLFGCCFSLMGSLILDLHKNKQQ